MSQDTPKELPPKYDPLNIEKKWYSIWEGGHYFSHKYHTNYISNNKYSIVIPPPNVTGSLHLGHALNHTIQDVLIRYRRMKGDATLWVPGTDHAGIATQNVVERLLLQEGKTRHDLGREKFLERVWQWKEHSGSTITHQQRQIGESPDWEYERFTFTEGMNQLVKLVFIKLYQEKLIYRAKRMINWCPVHQTALSNVEVEYKTIQGNLYHIRYTIENTDIALTVATTRPETMLGDEALAVHPNDERYKHYIGQYAIVPLIQKRIPIIADEYVDQTFGTGVVKITPAHDTNDFEIGKRHNLPLTEVMDLMAKINANGKQYQGLAREEARKQIIIDLKAIEALEKIENYSHQVGHSYRSGAIVEPMPSTQWFVDMKSLAKEAIEVVQDGKIEFIPKRWENTYFDWMNNIQDWCISRQLWWGHRIPAWYDENNNVYVGKSEEDVRTQYKLSIDIQLKQDDDVLDTWFSSGLWPFSVLWTEEELAKSETLPKPTQLHKMFYPTNVLVTGFDIIFFWVARMIMMGCHIMKEVPFKTVYIHGLVRDADRQKMSKSKGNVVNPLEKIEEYGTDAFRFFMMSILPEGKDIIYDESRLKGYQAFCNKLWNTARYIWMNQESNYKLPNIESIDKKSLSEIDIWILNKLNDLIIEVEDSLEHYRFAEYCQKIYDFTWKNFCDHYLELSKVSLKNENLSNGTRFTLNYVFTSILKLLHPIMPFITEELYSYWNGGSGNDLIIISKFPQTLALASLDKNTNACIDTTNKLIEIIYKIRNVRGELSIPLSDKINIAIAISDENTKKSLEYYRSYIQFLAKVDTLEFILTNETSTIKGIISILPFAKIYLDILDKIDIIKEKERLNKEQEKLNKEWNSLEIRLKNTQYVEKAPQEIVSQEKERVVFLKQKLEDITEVLSTLG